MNQLTAKKQKEDRALDVIRKKEWEQVFARLKKEQVEARKKRAVTRKQMDEPFTI